MSDDKHDPEATPRAGAIHRGPGESPIGDGQLPPCTCVGEGPCTCARARAITKRYVRRG